MIIRLLKICDLVDIVSKNGCLLLNIGPKADGTIPEEDKAILKEIGQWMKINGEAIYGSKVWRVSAEGPTVTEEGQFTDGNTVTYTSEDIRFTVRGSNLYATVLNYPENGEVIIKSLAARNAAIKPYFHGIIRDITVLGFDEKPQWERREDGLILKTTKVASDKPVVFKIVVD